MPGGIAWTERESEELILKVQKRGMLPRRIKIFDRFGRKRTYQAVADKITELRTLGRITRKYAKRPPDEQLTIKELLVIKKYSVEAEPDKRLGPAGLALLPELAHRSKSELGAIKHRYKLTDKKLSEKAMWAYENRLTPDEERKIVQYLRTDGKYLTDPLAGAECWVRKATICRLRKKYKLPRYTHAEAMQDPKYRSWYEAMVRERATTRMGRNRRKLRDKRRFLEQQKLRLPNREMRQCSVCGSEYPKTRIFFRRYENKLGRGRSQHGLTSVCTACPVKAEKKNRSQLKKLA